MKKLLAIVVLGLLLGESAYAGPSGKKLESQGKIYIGQDKSDFCNAGTLFSGVICAEHEEEVGAEYKFLPGYYYEEEGYEVIGNVKDNRFYILANVNHTLRSRGGTRWGDGTLVSIQNSLSQSKDFIKKHKKNSATNSTSVSTDDKITQSKKICTELGFKANSEKFADCALKMMAMQFETGNKVSNNDGSTTQKIIVKQQDNYDIGDAFFDLQKIIDNNYRSNNSNSSNTSSQRCKIYERSWGADMVCQ